MDNMDFKAALEIIQSADRILITTHARPDGDACGSMAALGEVLRSLGKEVELLSLSEVPEWYEFLFAEKCTVLGAGLTVEQLKSGELIEPDLIILVDVNSENQLEGFADYLKVNKKKVLVFDHHITSDGLGDIELVDTTASAAALIIYELFKYAGWEISEKAAESLFVGIATDTGWFRFSNTDSRTHIAASELLGRGVNCAGLYRELYQGFSIERFMLMGRMLGTLRLHFDGRYAEQHLLVEDFDATGAKLTDTENFIDECQRIKSVEAAGLFVELADGRVKCSLRSKSFVDVREVAQRFGGGGHKMASGVHLDGGIAEAKRLIFGAIEEQFSKGGRND